MIIVLLKKNRILLKGHAGYAQQGKDIVCAGVTALIQTLIKSIEDLTDVNIQYEISPGFVDLKFNNISKDFIILVNSFFIGISIIAGEFPDNVKIVQAWKT